MIRAESSTSSCAAAIAKADAPPQSLAHRPRGRSVANGVVLGGSWGVRGAALGVAWRP